MSESGGTSDLLPLTTAQRAIWASQLMHPEAPLHNQAFSFTIRGPIDVAAFRTAFDHLTADADSLRTVIVVEDGVPFQRVEPTVDYTVDVIDCSQAGDPAAAAEKWCLQRYATPLDMQRRTFDSVLLRLAADCYVWYFCQHHVATDATAVAVLYARMAELYAAIQDGTELPARDLPQYGDYVAYERSVVAARETSSRSAPPTIAPALYGIKREDVSPSNQRFTLGLGASRSAELRDLAQTPGIQALTPDLSLFQLFATAFFSYLHRVSGQSAITIGAPVHNRATADFKRSPGLFMEVYPLAVDVDDDDTFASLYDKVRTATANLLRTARPGGSSTEENRGVNAILNYLTTRFGPFGGAPVEALWLHPGAVDAPHHLRMQVHDFTGTGSFTIDFDCSTDVFPDELRPEMLRHFERIVTAMIEQWDRPLAEVDLMDDADRVAVASRVNEVPAASAPSATVVEAFLRRVAEQPDAVAIAHGEETWSYAEVDRASRSLAAQLDPGSIVGVALGRSPAAVLAMLAILRAGGAYLPIDPSWPEERVRFVVDDAGCSLVITDRPLDVGVPTVESATRRDDEAFVDFEIGSSDLAYVLYTSGSTGEPKGVMVEHGALSNYVFWASEFYDRGRGLTFPLFTPLTFDLTVTSIFVPLVSGGSIRVYGETSTKADVAVHDVFEEDVVDIVKLTPSHLALLPDDMREERRISQLILGGEDLTAAVARRAQRRLGDRVLIHNEYGPTEATVGCILHTYDPAADTAGSVPIGQPIAGMRAYVLDAAGHPVPFGVPGELHVAGPSLARGYLGKPELTAARFTAPEVIEEDRIYATGDLARIRSDGVLEYLGRGDDQIKIRGVRVELGEIEAAVGSHPDVAATTAQLASRGTATSTGELIHCVRCGLASDYPGVSFDGAGVCSECTALDEYRDRAQIYFKQEDQLATLLRSGRETGGEYDCIALLSGGKDSTYVLCRLVDMGLRVLAFTLDNGYISEQAKGNIQRVVETLGVDHIFATTPAMNEIFVDSLQRHANVCNGCFKTIYTLSMQAARDKKIPFIVTGLSRGQFFETRLTKELFTQLAVDSEQIDTNVLEARKAYHRVDDAVRQLLDVSVFEDDSVFDEVRYVDFYRYVDVGLDELYSYLDEKVPWVRPSDTGRSTNCLINDVGIYYHRKVRGYHNYALPYSWDVRMGHKTRAEALEELDDDIDVAEVARILDEIGFPGDIADFESGRQLVSYYVAPVEIPTPVLREHVAARVPHQAVPTQFVRLDRIPLTANGKVDKAALPVPDEHQRSVDNPYVAARTPTEELLLGIWEQVLAVNGIGVRDNYFDLGGDSIMAIQIVARSDEVGLQFEVQDLFESLTIEGLARVVDESIATAGVPAGDSSLPEISSDEMDALAAALQQLDGRRD